ncbi:MAG: hypothetical protein KAT68_11675 [Bacteroidales bacterium]|nr:hypothetical protein [Bacteroidales bacterium]
MEKKLLIGTLGVLHSGKTHTWNTLFKRVVKTGKNMRKLFLTDDEYVEVFLVSGSPGERHMYVGDIITAEKPEIILCSLQYTKEVIDTINYFIDNNYFLYIHWLNPGYTEQIEPPLFYTLGVINTLLSNDSLIGVRNAKTDVEGRVQEIRDFIYGWAKSRGLLLTKKLKIDN